MFLISYQIDIERDFIINVIAEGILFSIVIQLAKYISIIL